MTSIAPDWKSNVSVAAGKGATLQEFTAAVGKDRLEIAVAPWGEGYLKVNGREIAHVNDAKDRRQVFRKLKQMAERYLAGQPVKPENARGSVMIPTVKAKLLEGKRGLIVGIANEMKKRPPPCPRLCPTSSPALTG
jgi:enoyl-[acyl-carrier protein] reductase I